MVWLSRCMNITLLCLSRSLPIVIALVTLPVEIPEANLQELGSRNSLLISSVAYFDLLSQSRET